MSEKLSTKPYKGTRDFYPDEMRQRTKVFSSLEKTVRSFGFEKIDAPIVEPIEIYLAKTSEEIVNQQIYSFIDRGERRVAIRPEMTPTVARMFSGKARELPRPVRWFSIPNLWRYEQPGKGRLREHWQLNCDILGAPDEFLADAEIIMLAVEILKSLGATQSQFIVKLSHREILNSFFEKRLGLAKENWPTIARILDKKEKISGEEFSSFLSAAGIDAVGQEQILNFLTGGLQWLRENPEIDGAGYLLELMALLEKSGYSEHLAYDPGVVRGFDYYTGIVFEVFDTSGENRRSLFGGGRYDKLVSAFIKEEINAVGFGMGDVTLFDFLQTHQILPGPQRELQVFVASFPTPEDQVNSFRLAREIRNLGIPAEMGLGPAKLGKQLAEAAGKKISFAIIQGLEEKDRGVVQIKNLETGEQVEIPEEEIVEQVKAMAGDRYDTQK